VFLVCYTSPSPSSFSLPLLREFPALLWEALHPLLYSVLLLALRIPAALRAPAALQPTLDNLEDAENSNHSQSEKEEDVPQRLASIARVRKPGNLLTCCACKKCTHSPDPAIPGSFLLLGPWSTSPTVRAVGLAGRVLSQSVKNSID
jgi:hypothetical protein